MREMWLSGREVDLEHSATETSTVNDGDSRGVFGRLQKPKMWHSV